MCVIERNSETQVFLRSVLSTWTRNTRARGCSRDAENVSELLAAFEMTKYGICLKSRVNWEKTRKKSPMLFLETTKTQINEPLQTKQVQCTCYKTCVSDFRFDASKFFHRESISKKTWFVGFILEVLKIRGKHTQKVKSWETKSKKVSSQEQSTKSFTKRCLGIKYMKIASKLR